MHAIITAIVLNKISVHRYILKTEKTAEEWKIKLSQVTTYHTDINCLYEAKHKIIACYV